MRTFGGKYIVLSAFLFGCAETVEKSEVEPCPQATTPLPTLSEIPPYSLYAEDDETKGWARKAASLWEEASIGEIRFLTSESSECHTNAIIVRRRGEDWVSFANEIGADPNGFGTMVAHPEGCFEIWVRWPWAKDQETLFTSKFDTLGENPLVLVTAHEMGHAFKLDHVPTTSRSIMVEHFPDLRVNHPTCLDIVHLGLLFERPLDCKEDF